MKIATLFRHYANKMCLMCLLFAPSQCQKETFDQMNVPYCTHVSKKTISTVRYMIIHTYLRFFYVHHYDIPFRNTIVSLSSAPAFSTVDKVLSVWHFMWMKTNHILMISWWHLNSFQCYGSLCSCQHHIANHTETDFSFLNFSTVVFRLWMFTQASNRMSIMWCVKLHFGAHLLQVVFHPPFCLLTPLFSIFNLNRTNQHHCCFYKKNTYQLEMQKWI